MDRIEELCGEWSLPVLRVRSEPGRDSLVVGAPEEPALALVAHVDTISPPWPARRRGRRRPRPRARVRRTTRAASSPAYLPPASWSLPGEDLERLGVAFAFPVDEERGGSGSRTVALELAPARAIALEATGLRTGVAETGDIDAWVHVGRALGPRCAHRRRRERDPRRRRADHRAAVARARRATATRCSARRRPRSARSGAAPTSTRFPTRCSFQLQTRIVPGQDGDATLAALEAARG